jgi:hypothetical protein
MAARGSNLFPAVFLASSDEQQPPGAKVSTPCAVHATREHYKKNAAAPDSKSGAARVRLLSGCQKVFSIKNCTQRAHRLMMMMRWSCDF